MLGAVELGKVLRDSPDVVSLVRGAEVDCPDREPPLRVHLDNVVEDALKMMMIRHRAEEWGDDAQGGKGGVLSVPDVLLKIGSR